MMVEADGLEPLIAADDKPESQPSYACLRVAVGFIVVPALAAAVVAQPAVAAILFINACIGSVRYCLLLVPACMNSLHYVAGAAWFGSAVWLVKQSHLLAVQIPAIVGGAGASALLALSCQWPQSAVVRSRLLAVAYIMAALATLLLLVCT